MDMTQDPLVQGNAPQRPVTLSQLESALRQQPDRADLWLAAGTLMAERGDTLQAERAFHRVTVLAPHERPGWIQLGRAAATLGRREDAAHAYARAVACDPNNPESQVRLAACLIGLGRLDEAGPVVQRALTLDPEGSGARAVAARLAHRRGDLDAAWAWVENRPVDPWIIEVVAALALARKRPQDAIAAVRKGIEGMTGDVRSLFLKYEGDLWEAMGDAERAWAAWSASNRERRLVFRPEAHRAGIRDLIARSRGPYVPEPHPDADLPVLIVGVPRSGTTLLEQALGCHPAVAPAGELTTLRHLGLAVRTRGFPDWAHALHALPDEDWERAAQGYLTRLRAVDAHAPRITDKMPNNLMQLGFLARILPGTRVVLCHRDPVDTGFSCFRQTFGPGLAWSTDIDWTACWIEESARLWRHWRDALPLRFHTVSYERLVRAPAAVLRGVLDFLALPWDDAVLRPDQHERAVATASMFEVSEPIHAGSVGRAEAYAAHLGPLLELRERGCW